MDKLKPFSYVPGCSAPGCDQPATYKIAATWSYGPSRELKTYGLACESHRESQFAAARSRLVALKLSEGESVGPIELYVKPPGCRDADLQRFVDAGPTK